MDWGTILVTGLVAILSAAVGGVIGAYGALKVSKVDNAATDARAAEERTAALALSREERVDNRRKEAYLELTKAVAGTLQPFADYLHNPVGFFPAASFDAFVSARAFALFGSADVHRMYHEVFAKFTIFSQQSGDLQQRRVQYDPVQVAALAFEEQIRREMSPE